MEDGLLVCTDWARAKDLAIAFVHIEVDGSFLVVADDTAVPCLGKLREDCGTLGNDTADLDKLV